MIQALSPHSQQVRNRAGSSHSGQAPRSRSAAERSNTTEWAALIPYEFRASTRDHAIREFCTVRAACARAVPLGDSSAGSPFDAVSATAAPAVGVRRARRWLSQWGTPVIESCAMRSSAPASAFMRATFAASLRSDGRWSRRPTANRPWNRVTHGSPARPPARRSAGRRFRRRRSPSSRFPGCRFRRQQRDPDDDPLLRDERLHDA